jgi:hypothetical protein
MIFNFGSRLAHWNNCRAIAADAELIGVFAHGGSIAREIQAVVV